MADIEHLRKAQDWAVIGAVLLGVTFVAAVCCWFMGFDFRPLDHPSEYWAEQASSARLVLAGTVAMGAASAGAFAMTVRRARTEATLAACGVVGIVLVVLVLWFAVGGAVTNIDSAETWATAPPI